DLEGGLDAVRRAGGHRPRGAHVPARGADRPGRSPGRGGRGQVPAGRRSGGRSARLSPARRALTAAALHGTMQNIQCTREEQAMVTGPMTARCAVQQSPVREGTTYLREGATYPAPPAP